LKEDFLTPLGYRKISKILNDESFKTPLGNKFSNSHVFSIYSKGLKRLERINRPDVVEVSDFNLEYFNSFSQFHRTYRKEKKIKNKYFSFRRCP